MSVLNSYLSAFGVSDPEFQTRTRAASVWRVRRACGGFAALKVYAAGHMGNEAAGFAYLQDHAAGPAAAVFAATEDAALTQWLEGPDLREDFMAGDFAEPDRILLQVAQGLHGLSLPCTPGWPRLSQWFAPLLAQRFEGECDVARAMVRACGLARHLLETERDIGPLHGDLHHGNVRMGPHGWTAFDAKGIVGERAYELANAFRHPLRQWPVVCDPGLIRARLTLWSGGLSTDPQRLMQWVVAKAALSVVWRSAGRVREDPEGPLLLALSGVLDQMAG